MTIAHSEDSGAQMGNKISWPATFRPLPKKIYPYRIKGTPHRHQLRPLFPVCITVLWVLGSYADSIQQAEQLYRQGKVVYAYVYII